jgi:predicted enzyme related to lactoylglutathione lyase
VDVPAAMTDAAPQPPATGRLLVNIDVDDLGRATAFYGEAFGLVVGRRFGDQGVELLGLAAPLYLLRKPDGSLPVPGEPRRRRNYSRHWTPVHLDIVVDDLQVALARVLSAGANLDHPLRSTPFGEVALMSDPFGNGFCLIEFRGRGYDEIAGPPGAGHAPD